MKFSPPSSINIFTFVSPKNLTSLFKFLERFTVGMIMVKSLKSLADRKASTSGIIGFELERFIPKIFKFIQIDFIICNT